MRPKSLAVRLLLGAGLWVAVALIVSGFLLSALYNDYVERNFDSRLNAILEAIVAVSDVEADKSIRLTQTPPGRLAQPFSGWYWQIADEKGPILRSRSLWDQVLETRPQGAREDVLRFETPGPEGATLRAVQRAIRLPGSEQTYFYAVAADVAVMGADIESFNTALGWSLGALGLGLVVAVFLQVRYGLRPLRRIEASLGAIRSGLARRLEEDFPSEINPLAKEINALLEHNASLLERARTHVGNLAHSLKTPLAVLRNDAANADGPLAESVARQAAVMQRNIDHHLTRARTAAARDVLGARTEVGPTAEDLRRMLTRHHAERAIRIELEVGEGVAFRGERQDLEEMLGNLMDNACKWAKSQVRVSAVSAHDTLRLSVEDDGPGLAPGARDAALNRGERLDESVPGSGLGLAIVRDIADLYGGEIALEEASLGGLKALLILPAANVATKGAPRPRGA
ncbi:MAG: ATP-binding protein [Alphaproteobacteria bacterium]